MEGYTEQNEQENDRDTSEEQEQQSQGAEQQEEETGEQPSRRRGRLRGRRGRRACASAPSGITSRAARKAKASRRRRRAGPTFRCSMRRKPSAITLHAPVRRSRGRRSPLRRRRTRPPARLPRQAPLDAACRGQPPCQPVAAPPARATEPRLGVRPRRGHARRRAALPRRHRPVAPAILHARARHDLPRHGGDASARQFRLDARAADHGCRLLCRYPRRTLERCGVKAEILGFTTRQWKGGQSRESWLAAGKPSNPGRLNDLRHIIYKAADIPWRRARRNLGR